LGELTITLILRIIRDQIRTRAHSIHIDRNARAGIQKCATCTKDAIAARRARTSLAVRRARQARLAVGE
jgi:formate dehydrogenase assembly factor FdhD